MPPDLAAPVCSQPDPFGAPLLDLDPVPSDRGRTVLVEKTQAATLLTGGASSDIMQRLLEGDPLEVGPRSRERMSHQAVLLDPARLKWRALAYCAFLAARDGFCREAPLGHFLDHAIDESIASLIEEDWVAESEGRAVTQSSSPFQRLPGAARLSPERARRIALEFNLQRRRERRPLFAILVESRPPAEVALAFDLTNAELGAKLHKLLDRMEASS